MKKAAELLQRYNKGTATPAEKAWVESWYLNYKVGASDLTTAQLEEEHELGHKQLRKQIHKTYIRLWRRLAAAAILLTVLGLGLFFWNAQRISNIPKVVLHTEDIAPGGNRATLRLTDGRMIELSENQSGIVINDNTIRYADGSALSEDLTAVTYAILSTPEGGQYQVSLPDGTQVWLNAASTLTYPIQFDKQARTVELTGEAYFEVAPQASSHSSKQKTPFIVKTTHQHIEVLGTHFNVNAYTNESSPTTTLQEGSIRVWIPNTDHEALLAPNQQASIVGETIQVKHVDASDAMAWKEGFFVFDNNRLEDVMKSIARWYNIDIQYEDDRLKNERFSGSISKYTHVSNVLKKLALTGGVRFELKDRQIIIK